MLNGISQVNSCALDTPISIVCEEENEILIKYLIGNGAGINTKYKLIDMECSQDKYYSYINHNIQSTKFKTPLIYACEKGNIPLLKYLIEYGADINLEYESYEFHNGYNEYNYYYCYYKKIEYKPI